MNRFRRSFLKLVDLVKDPRNPMRAPYYLLGGGLEVPDVDLDPGMGLDFCLTVDVEHDFGIPSTLGELSTVVEGLENLLELFDGRGVEGCFFVSHPVLEEFSGLVEDISKTHEVGVHGYDHECWSDPRWWLGDDRILDEEEKGKFLDEMIESVESVTGEKPLSFRTPYMTADMETLQLLVDRGFEVDSSASSHCGVFPKPWRVEDSSLFEIPVSASPVPKFSFSPYPHYRFDFLIMRLLGDYGLEKFLKIIENILKFQKSESVSPYLVMVLHQWEFAKLDDTPTKGSKYALRNNHQKLDKMLEKLEKRFEISYTSLKNLKNKIED